MSRRTLRALIQFSALCLTLESAFFLVRGNLGLSAEVIAKLASTGWGYNVEIVKSLASQRADTCVGFVLLLFAFGLQMVNAFWRMVIDDYDDANKAGKVWALVFSLIVFVGAYLVSNGMSLSTQSKVNKILSSPTSWQPK